ncbi:mediator of RNA polymerase II transcription subunit 23 [Cimex lectularius]|uniref:Mediator of RNA polymerase II transcription subunit 23 n=1 Tax=Cimex lectularius TaxID=79782 RepID=A0A8I6RAF9_CIMLE|nr:mediator of RNA polymerase II transcription subunit 23 [Cimex lectularius]
MQVSNIVNDILRVEPIEEAFSCFLVRKECDKSELLKELQTVFTVPPAEQEIGVKQFLAMASTITNHSRLQHLFTLLENLVTNGTLPAKLVCECILSCDKLVYQLENFWVNSFILIRNIISGVNYKGVRDILKGCFEKARSIPPHINSSVIRQMKALENVMYIIFNRNVSLLPAYFIANELYKLCPDGKNWPHWKLAALHSDYVESFRPTAQMLSIIGHSSMLPVVEHSGYADHLINPWKLDPNTLKLALKGNLPYDKSLTEPQTNLLRYVLEQPYSRDMVCSMLGLQKQHKQRCVALEEQLVVQIMLAMEKTENESSSSGQNQEGSDDDFTQSRARWFHLCSQLIYFVLCQFASFQNIVMALHEKLSVRNLRKGRDHLMWVLLQFISGSIQRNSLSSFLPVLKLFDLLYPEKEPLPVPDYTKPICIHQLSIVCIWIHLLKKAQSDHVNIPRPVPNSLKLQHEFLQHLVANNMGSDYKIAILCNAYSTNSDYFNRPMAALVETIIGNQKGGGPPQGTSSSAQTANLPTTPLSMTILDSLTVHSKMSLIHGIVSHVLKLAQSKSNMALAPALVETYSRLLVYTEIESLGIKGFISQLLPNVFKFHAWGILYTLLEMFNYRIHHIQPHYRVQLLSHLHSLAAVPQTNQTQLHLCVESTALRLITGLGSSEVQPQLSRFLSEPKTLVSAESEELNRALVLTLARSMHVTGTGSDAASGAWCKELLNTIMQNTPHSWPPHTLQFFPPVLSDFFQQNHLPMENKHQLKKAVEEEYRNWASMNNENDIIAHFSVPGTPPLFLCLIWKMILETDRISPIAYKILERIGARALSAHLRKFCDYLVFQFAISGEGHLVNKFVDSVNNMIWKYNIVTIDRLVLCMALRTHEGNDAQLCFYIIQLLLFKAAQLRNRVKEFVKENSPQHWKQSNWHEKHLAFHRNYPEKFAPEGILEATGSSSFQSLPVYFGNVCLRFLPVFDIVIHRCLELTPQVAKSLETLLDLLGSLYKFHDRPVTYLYNTFHYYEKKVRDKPQLKRKLVSAVLSNMTDSSDGSKGWNLSEPYQNYMQQQLENWVPELEYYAKLLSRIVDTMSGTSQCPPIDWRFNEFPNPSARALYVTCVELMALPVPPSVVANSLLNVITKGYTVIPNGQIQLWINSVGLVMASLPDSYWTVLQERLIEVISCSSLTSWPYRNSPFQLFNFSTAHNSFLENKFAYTLALAHATWHHAGVGHLATIPTFVKEKLTPLVKTEEQLLFLCHLIGPFLQRFHTDQWLTMVQQITSEFYACLEQVDKAVPDLKYMDPITDLLYHIKYMFVGDTMKMEAETVIRRLRPALQVRLRFIANHQIEETDQQQRDQSVNIGGAAPAGTLANTPLTTIQQQSTPMER